MAEELQNIKTKEQDEEKLMSNSPPSSSEDQVETKHEFSIPWRNSDIVLIIEDEKLHVHRLILELTSPVLCHLFKETDSNEVPLLRTNVSDFVDLLRVIYPHLENKITLYNIEHIYRLAEEYQIESVIKVCREYLVQVKKTTTNAMKILVTAQVCEADEVRRQCYEVLKGLTVSEWKSDQNFEDLDEESLRNVLLPKAEQLEKCLRDTQPQLVGLIDCVLYLWFKYPKEMGGSPKKCPEHYYASSTKTYNSMETRIKCSLCKRMFQQMASNTVFEEKYSGEGHYYSGSGAYFDVKIVDVLQEMFSI